jgi:hypothetical protein
MRFYLFLMITIGRRLLDLMVLDPKGSLSGLLTSCDLLRIMALGIKEDESNDTILSCQQDTVQKVYIKHVVSRILRKNLMYNNDA